MLKDTWVDKVNGEDEVDAKPINDIANAVIDLENQNETNIFNIENNAQKILQNQNDIDELDLTVDELKQVDIITNKRLANLESATLDFIEDSTVAYQKIVPEDALPYAKVQKIGGMTRKCTNIIPFPYYQTSVESNGLKFEVLTDGGIKCVGTATAYTNFYLVYEGSSQRKPISAGSYTISVTSTGGSADFIVGVTGIAEYNSSVGSPKSFTVQTDTTFYARLRVNDGVSINATFYPMLNKGSEPLPYEPYFEGLRSAPVSELVSEGVNIWDEQWKKASWTSAIESSNYIPVSPNTKYFMTHVPANGLFFYDKNKVQIKTIYDAIFTTPDNCYFIKFALSSSYGTVYLNDVCINKYDTAINGTYHPYFKRAFPISQSVRLLDGYGKGVNELVYNYIDYEKKQYVKQVGVVDMGTLGWNNLSSNLGNSYSASVPNMKTPQTVEDRRTGFLCALYSPSQNIATDNLDDKGMVRHAVMGICVRDTNYTNVSTFKSAMSGVLLYYELATPEVIDISNLITDDNYIEVEGGGTITAVNEYNFAVPTTIDYVTDIGE